MEIERQPFTLHPTAANNHNLVVTNSSPCASSNPHTSSIHHDMSTSASKISRSMMNKKKLEWLWNNQIGIDIEFDSPFGKRRVTYADTTASGRCLYYIENYLIKHVLPYYGNTHTCDSYVGQLTTKMSEEATSYIKTCLGCGTKSSDSIILCGSGSTSAIKRLQEVMGISIPSTLRSIAIDTMEQSAADSRWVVFVGPYEHHSNYLSWKQSLAQVIEIGFDEDGLIDYGELKEKLEEFKFCGRPMLGSFSACSNVTGIVTDTRKIAALLHQYGAFACFDFSASAPYVDIKMKSGEMDGYDAIFLSTHKFIGGPGSPGILLMNNDLYKLKSSPPSTCGGGTVNFVNGYDEKDTLYLDDIQERENAGTPPIIQKIKAALTFWVKEYIGYETIEQQEDYYIQRAMERLVPNQNIWILGNTNVKRQPILSFLVYSKNKNHTSSSSSVEYYRRGKPLHGGFVAKLLNDLFGIQARGGCACAGPYAHYLLGINHKHSLALASYVKKGYCGVKPGWTRVSFPYYMIEEEFESILLALEFIADYGQRFLPLYHFSWESGNWTFMIDEFEKTMLQNGYNACSSILADHMPALKLGCDGLIDEEEEGNYERNRGKVDVGILREKFEIYLRDAKEIASLLPEFCSKRDIPSDIDPYDLLFRI